MMICILLPPPLRLWCSVSAIIIRRGSVQQPQWIEYRMMWAEICALSTLQAFEGLADRVCSHSAAAASTWR